MFVSKIGLADDDIFVLAAHPGRGAQGHRTRHRTGAPAGDPRVKLVFSHPAGDEGNAYMTAAAERIADAAIDVRFMADRVSEQRGTDARGEDSTRCSTCTRTPIWSPTRAFTRASATRFWRRSISGSRWS
jgi:hypothetical protein